MFAAHVVFCISTINDSLIFSDTFKRGELPRDVRCVITTSCEILIQYLLQNEKKNKVCISQKMLKNKSSIV